MSIIEFVSVAISRDPDLTVLIDPSVDIDALDGALANDPHVAEVRRWTAAQSIEIYNEYVQNQPGFAAAWDQPPLVWSISLTNGSHLRAVAEDLAAIPGVVAVGPAPSPSEEIATEAPASEEPATCTIEVLNATGTPGLAAEAIADLDAALANTFAYANTDLAPPANAYATQATSAVLLDTDANCADLASFTAEILGIAAVHPAPWPSEPAQAIPPNPKPATTSIYIVLGDDFTRPR